MFLIIKMKILEYGNSVEEHLLCMCEIPNMASSFNKNENDNGVSI